MLDVNDFIKERGGDPEKVRESQRRRHANVELVDEIIALFEDHRKSASLIALTTTGNGRRLVLIPGTSLQPSTARPK